MKLSQEKREKTFAGKTGENFRRRNGRKLLGDFSSLKFCVKGGVASFNEKKIENQFSFALLLSFRFVRGFVFDLRFKRYNATKIASRRRSVPHRLISRINLLLKERKSVELVPNLEHRPQIFFGHSVIWYFDILYRFSHVAGASFEVVGAFFMAAHGGHN